MHISRGATSLDDLRAGQGKGLLGLGKALMLRSVFAFAAMTRKTNKMVLVAMRPIDLVPASQDRN